ncbi:MAG: glycyl-radical enzyme activating protein [Promethearchaeota archaeon]
MRKLKFLKKNQLEQIVPGPFPIIDNKNETEENRENISTLQASESFMEIQNLKGYIFEIEKLSTEDGPGIRTTVFFKQCPLRCLWCHNPESIEKKPSIQWFDVKCIGCGTCVEVCPNKAIRLDTTGVHIDRKICQACGICVDNCPSTALRRFGEYISLGDLMKEIKKDMVYYIKSGGGVTASGGAAAMQPRFVSEFFKACKKEGIHTALDLMGYLPRENYEMIFPYTDLFLYDLKEIDPVKHKEFTGVSNERILENAIWLKDKIKGTDKKIWIRTPVIPTFTARDDNIRGIGKFIVEKMENLIDRWDLLAFNNLAKDKYKRMDWDYACKGLELLTREEMDHFLEVAKSTGANNVRWSGLTKTEKKKQYSGIDEKVKEIRDTCTYK